MQFTIDSREGCPSARFRRPRHARTPPHVHGSGIKMGILSLAGGLLCASAPRSAAHMSRSGMARIRRRSAARSLRRRHVLDQIADLLDVVLWCQRASTADILIGIRAGRRGALAAEQVDTFRRATWNSIARVDRGMSRQGAVAPRRIQDVINARPAGDADVDAHAR